MVCPKKGLDIYIHCVGKVLTSPWYCFCIDLEPLLWRALGKHFMQVSAGLEME